MTIEIESPAYITSRDIDELWVFLNDKTINAMNGNNLNELFDNQQQFIAYYNEWETLRKRLTKDREDEYIQYMDLLESRNPSIDNALNISGISFDEGISSTDMFIKTQANLFESVFPFAGSEIVGWDSGNFILRDSIYYGTTGKRAVFFLARLDNKKELV
jgi:hypothetical protein